MLKLFAWTIAAMICIDVSLGVTLRHSNANWSRTLRNYFSYGASIESKVRQQIGQDNQSASNLAKAGWFRPRDESENDPHKQTILIYGMSFSNHVAADLKKLNDKLNIEAYAGPGAPLNHSFAYIESHRPFHSKEIVILGILASSLVKMNTLTAMTPEFESPALHFYPKYTLDSNNILTKKELQINSLNELRSIFNNEKQWGNIKRQLNENDKFYYNPIFSTGISDLSIYAKMFKRGLAQKHKKAVINRYHDKHGFKNTDRLIDVSQALIEKFAHDVRQDGAYPYVILFNDRGYNSDLYTVLKPSLIKENIPFYSTHKDFPAANLANFLGDGHFTPEIDAAITKKVQKGLNKIYPH